MALSSLQRRVVLICGVAALILSLTWPAATSAESLADDAALRRRAVTLALRWLQAQQLPDGGWGEGGVSSARDTAAAVLAISSSGESISQFQYGGLVGPLDALAGHVAAETVTADGTAQLILAVVAGGGDPRDFVSLNLVTILDGHRRSDGRFQADASDGILAHSLALLAMIAVDEPVPSNAKIWLRGQQNPDGGWPSFIGQSGDTETTSIAVQALAAADVPLDDSTITKAVSYLRSMQGRDAGFLSDGSASGTATTTTGQTLLALAASGNSLLDPHLLRGGQSPLELLLQRQRADGSFVQEASDGISSLAATTSGVLGLMGKSLPLRGQGYAVRRALDWLGEQQLPDGSFGSGPVTADAVRAIALAGEDPASAPWDSGDYSAVEALQNLLVSQPVIRSDAGQLGKALRATAAIGANPRTFGGLDLVEAMGQLYDAQSGWYHSGHAFKHALALEGLLAVGESVPDAAIQALQAEQRSDGGWGWPIGGDTSDNDTTGRVLSTLVKSGVEPTNGVFLAALDYLVGRQLSDAGWGGFLEDSPSNSNSAALVSEGLLNLGHRLADPPFATLSARGVLISPVDALLGFQERSGAFAYTHDLPESRLLAVLDSIPALITDQPGLQSIDATITADPLETRVAAPGDLRLLLPFHGDGDGDAQVSLRFRADAGESWTERTMERHGVLFAGRLSELQPGAPIEIELALHDPDGVTGGAEQFRMVASPLGLWLPTVMR